jgi:hypothetical protein
MAVFGSFGTGFGSRMVLEWMHEQGGAYRMNKFGSYFYPIFS